MRQLIARKRSKSKSARQAKYEILPSEKRSEMKRRAVNARLSTAAADGNIAGMGRALEQGADINMKQDGLGLTPLHRAAIYGKGRACAFLITKGADLSVTDRLGYCTPLQAATLYGYRAKIVPMIADALALALIGKENGEAFISSFRACLASNF